MRHTGPIALQGEEARFKRAAWIVVGLIAMLLSFPLQPFTLYMRIASLNFLALWAGYFAQRYSIVAHVGLMTAAVLSDLGLLFVIEFQRHAIQTATSFELSPMQQTHVVFSTLAVVTYVPTLILGARAYRRPIGSGSSLWHRRLGVAVLIFRTLGFALMFSMLSRPR